MLKQKRILKWHKLIMSQLLMGKKVMFINKLMGVFGLMLTVSVTASDMINGSGSSFVYPVMSQWTSSYYQKTGQKINYQPIGSSGGINQLKAKTVSFAASDQPLSATELKSKGWHQFPIAMSGIVPVINIPGIESDKLILNGKILAGIYLGEYKYWDDEDIQKLNPTLKLPHLMIIPIHRADGSGTTYNFSYYLSQVSMDFKKKLGVNTLISWPGMGIGGKGNAGVANQVEHISGAIGYVEYAYCAQSHLKSVKMVNRSGQVVSANLDGFSAAVKGASWSKDNAFYLILANQKGMKSWPMVATTFIMVSKNTKDKAILHAFFKWAFSEGRQAAKNLDYVTLPERIYNSVTW